MSEMLGAGREASLARTFVTIADTLVDNYDVTDLFDQLTVACVELLGATTAGLMLADHDGRLQLAASSNEQMRALETLELTHSEGPCVECYRTGQPITADLRDPATAQRWPRFTVEALRSPFATAQALPMRLRGQTIGALNLFHTDASRIDDHNTSLAQALADVATIALLQRRALSVRETLSEQLQEALNARIVIEQAKGVLAERGQLDVDQAFDLLRRFCRSARLPLTETARDIVTGRRDPDDVLATRWPGTPD
jgi:transcriptional regulator with GAF, ATPase, and Fis domain